MKTTALLEKIEDLESTVDALLVIAGALVMAAPDKSDLLAQLREQIGRQEGRDPRTDAQLEAIQASLAAHIQVPQVLH